jgi:hypothetical protein
MYHLSRRHVVFNPDNSATITLPASKTDRFRRGIAIQLASCPSSNLCPVRALRQLFNDYPRTPTHPLFSRSYRPFSRQYLVDRIRSLLLRAGTSTKGFSGHSIRKGAAVTAAANGISKDDIKLLGRWKSDAVDTYINELHQFDFTRKLLNLNSKLHNFTPPKLVFSLATATQHAH